MIGGDADEPYLALKAEVDTDGDGKFNCHVVSLGIINDPEEKTLISELNSEKFRRKFRRPPNEEDEV